jgi:Tfp pilus assembly protein FimT
MTVPSCNKMMRRYLRLHIVRRLFSYHHSLKLKPSFAFLHLQSCRPERGMSLLEALVVLFIIAVSAAAMAPNLVSWRAGMRLQSVVNELLGDLHSAKALAAKHNTTMTVQFEPAQSRYQITYANAEGEIVALKDEALPPELRIDSAHPDYTLVHHRTAFTSRGGATPGTLVVSNFTGKSRKIVISSIGKIRTEK